MVVIEDVDMPKNCAECNCFLCKYHSKIWLIDNKCYQDSRHPSCPIKEFDYMSVLEDIKAEIESITPKATVRYGKLSTEQTLMIPQEKVMDIIDKYIIGKEQTDGKD